MSNDNDNDNAANSGDNKDNNNDTNTNTIDDNNSTCKHSNRNNNHDPLSSPYKESPPPVRGRTTNNKNTINLLNHVYIYIYIYISNIKQTHSNDNKRAPRFGGRGQRERQHA